MKALLLTAHKHLELAELPTPAPAHGEVLLRVAACGICGSDVHGYDGSTGRRIPPVVMGHEAAGCIAAVGEGVAGFAVGDRVTLDSTVFCGECAHCRRGEINLCDHRQVLGVSCGDYHRAGAFAEFVAVPARVLHHLPQALPFEEAAMLEAAAVAIHAVSLAPLVPRDTALVVGAGTIGLLCLQALRAAGCSRILIADVDSARLQLAASFGGTPIFSADSNTAAQVLALTHGRGADVVLEAVGLDATVSDGIESVRKGGTVVLVGNVTPEVRLPLQKVVTRQIRLQGSCASSGEYPRAIELMASGAINVKPFISAVAPLEEGPRWFERLYAREPNLLKVVLRPGSLS